MSTWTRSAVKTMLRLAAVTAITSIFPLVLLGAVLGNPRGAEPAELVVRDVTLVDVVKGTLSPDSTIVIGGDRIKAIGASGAAIHASRGARVIDGRGKYVIPGLTDSHVHFESQLNHCHMTGDEILPLYLACGVTSLRDAGDEIVAEKLVARYAAEHPERAPRVFLCSPLIDSIPPHHHDIGWGIPQDPAAVPAFVDDMAGWGVVTLKVYRGITPPVGRKLIEEGHRHGMTVIGHLTLNYTPVQATQDGMDSLEHAGPESILGLIASRLGLSFTGDYADSYNGDIDLNSSVAQDVVAELAKTKVMVDPTLVIYTGVSFRDVPAVAENPDNLYMPMRWQKYCAGIKGQYKPGTLERRKTQYKKYEELTGMLYRAGIPILAGTDSPFPFCPAPGFCLLRELELLVESGLTPTAALQAATINIARCMKQDRDMGSIEEGKRADLVILNANPLANISNVRNIDTVIKGGLVCDPQWLLKQVPKE
jgi:hypothetical protein